MTIVVKSTPFIAADLLAMEPDLAAAYVELRQRDAEAFCRSLYWVSRDMYSVKADVFGHQIRHELKPGWLHAYPVWGELYWDDKERHGTEPIIFVTMECYIAYILARFY